MLQISSNLAASCVTETCGFIGIVPKPVPIYMNVNVV